MTAPPRADAVARVFFALWPGAETRRQFAQWTQALRGECGGRAMRDENLHLTLVFIGNLAAGRLDALEAAAAGIACAPFLLEFERPAFWRRNRIVCAEPVAVPPALAELVAGLEAALAQAGVGFDRRPYVPHTTLLRNAHRGPAEFSGASIRWQVDGFALLCSQPEAGGVRYWPLASWPGQAR